MNNIFLLLNKMPLPVIIHDESKLIHSNKAFNNLASLKENETTFDFLKWLPAVIKNENHIQTLVQGIRENNEIKLETEAFVNGVARYWKIYSFPFLINSTIKHQVTCVKDKSPAYEMKSYWDLHSRADKTSMQLFKEISHRKKIEAKAAELSEELVFASRQAGMAEVSASMLHNVGNVLNTVGISLGYLKEKVNSTLFSKMLLTHDLLEANKTNLLDYFQNDKKGKLLPEYLVSLFAALVKEHHLLKNEITNLVDAFAYIREIVVTQNEIARHTTVIEKVLVSDLIDSAINLIMSNNSLILKNISLIKEYNYNAAITVDRSYLIQILINLIKNAKEAVQDTNENKIKTISIKSNKSQQKGYIEIEVSDTGVGISAKNLKKIFMFGFSKKKKGHGFGLHNSALMAEELGGSLTAMSEGIGKGSRFILILPIEQHKLEQETK